MPALIPVGAAVAGGMIANHGAKKAASIQAAAADRGIEEQRRAFDLIRSDLAPYRDRGYQAGNRLAMMMGLMPHAGTYTGDITKVQSDPLFGSGMQQRRVYTPGESSNALQRYMRGGK